MKKIFLILLICVGLVRCDSVRKSLYPDPQIVTNEYKPQLLGYDEYHLVIHNAGAEGNIFIQLRRGSDTYTETLFFSKGERRTVVIKLTGDSEDENIHYKIVAAELKDN